MLENPVKNLKDKDVLVAFAAFRREIGRLIQTFDPDLIAVERYSSRQRGVTIEYVNNMIGVVMDVVMRLNKKRKDPTQMVNLMPMTWKARAKKFVALDTVYSRVDIPDHIVDATFIGLYGAERFSFSFDQLTDRKLTSLLAALGAKSTVTRKEWNAICRQKAKMER